MALLYEVVAAIGAGLEEEWPHDGEIAELGGDDGGDGAQNEHKQYGEEDGGPHFGRAERVAGAHGNRDRRDGLDRFQVIARYRKNLTGAYGVPGQVVQAFYRGYVGARSLRDTPQSVAWLYDRRSCGSYRYRQRGCSMNS